MSEWNYFEDGLPQVGDVILAELRGCKVTTHVFMTVREGEILDNIKRWKLIRREKNPYSIRPI